MRDRDTIVNLHFGIPRKNGNRDDVQLLFDNNFIDNIGYNSSTNDQGGAAFLNDIGQGTPTYQRRLPVHRPAPGTLLPAAYNGGGAVPYLFPRLARRQRRSTRRSRPTGATRSSTTSRS